MKTKAILFAAYGIEDDKTRDNTIGKLTVTASLRYPDYEIKTAFTSERMVQKVTEKGINIRNVSDTLKTLAEAGVKEVVVQPLHMIYSGETDRLYREAEELSCLFERVKRGKPLLADTADYFKISDGLNRAYPLEEGECLVLMGHGTKHYANASYAALAYTLRERNCKHIFLGALEAYPGMDVIRKEVEACHPQKVKLAPFLFAIAGHAKSDMAGDQESSWKSQIRQLGYPVEVLLKGFGDMEEFRNLYMDHLAAAL